MDDASRVSFMVLAVLLVPVGIVIVAVGFLALALILRALGSPTGIVASAITIGGLLGILAALFFSFRALYRRMPRRLREAYAGPPPGPPEPMRGPVMSAGGGAAIEPASPGGLERGAPVDDGIATTGFVAPSADLTLDERIDVLVSQGGLLTFSYSPRHKLRLSLRRLGSRLQVTGSIDNSRLLDRPLDPSRGSGHESLTTSSVLPVRRTVLREMGWTLDQKRVLSRSWAVDSAAERQQCRREVGESMVIVDTGDGDAQRLRNATELELTIEIFSSLVISAVGAGIGAVAGFGLSLVFGSGTWSWPMAVLGVAVGFVVGVTAGMVGLSQVVPWADRLRWFRGRLELAWLAAAVLSAGLTALALTWVIARL